MQKNTDALLKFTRLLGVSMETEQQAELLRTIGDSDDPMVLQLLLPYLLDSVPSIAKVARQSAERLLLKSSPEMLSRVEQETRRNSRRGHAATDRNAPLRRWQLLTASALRELSREPEAFSILALASFHDSGFVREAAVRMLDAFHEGRELLYLLLRANDWVAEVRQAALRAITRRLSQPYAESFLHNISLCDRLAEVRRNNLGKLREAIYALLKSKEARAVRLVAFSAAQRQVRRAAFRLAADSGDDIQEVVLHALHSNDLWLRIWGTRTARARMYGPALRKTLGQARQDRSTPVRREALLGFVAEHPELLAGLMDPAASLREMVRFYLRQSANLDFAAVYRGELEQASKSPPGADSSLRLAIAISGLGETGSRADAHYVEEFIHDKRARIRYAALTAHSRLATELAVPNLLAALSDSSSRVLRGALTALGTHITVASRELLAAYQGNHSSGCRSILVAHMPKLPRWQAAVGLLAACNDTDAEIVSLAQRLLLTWLQSSNSYRPTRAECAHVHSKLVTTRLPTVLRVAMERLITEWSQST